MHARDYWMHPDQARPTRTHVAVCSYFPSRTRRQHLDLLTRSSSPRSSAVSLACY
jgi:hypothetical protein